VPVAEPRRGTGAAVFNEICETMSDEMLFSCLRVIVSIAQKRGLVHWFTEKEQAPIQ